MTSITASSSAYSPPPLVVWDFDWSLVNENSDTFIVKALDPTGSILAAAERKLSEGMQWTALMDWVAGQLSAAGHDAEAMEAALRRIPVLGRSLAAVETARSHGAEQRILSDANALYIRWTLRALGIADAFSVIETNGAAVDPAGRLHISPHQPPHAAHGCRLCPPNLCKGAVLERWLREGEGEGRARRCAYVGDGGGDFCPALRLRRGDALFARQPPHDGLLRKCRAGGGVEAAITEWSERDDGAALHDGLRDFLVNGKREGGGCGIV
uniref:Uncharacterized protein n=1 Tax=Emiliania huxleyi TaxID=2903 RepID=A0A6V2LPJ4_EMIHU